MPDFTSVVIMKQMDTPVNPTVDQINSAAAGSMVATLDADGIAVATGYKLKSQGNIIHDKQMHKFTAALANGAVSQWMWSPSEGNWQVSAVNVVHSTSGGANATVDVVVGATAITLANSTSQLTAALAINATVDVLLNPALSGTLSTIGPGSKLGLVFASAGAWLGTVTVSVKRIS